MTAALLLAKEGHSVTEPITDVLAMSGSGWPHTRIWRR
ncbi:hypothetical protein [Nocardia sp. NBC_00508]